MSIQLSASSLGHLAERGLQGYIWEIRLCLLFFWGSITYLWQRQKNLYQSSNLCSLGNIRLFRCGLQLSPHVLVRECNRDIPDACWCKYLVNGVWRFSRLVCETDHSRVVSSRQGVDFQSLRSQSPKMTPCVSVLCFTRWNMISDSSSADVLCQHWLL